MNHEDALEAMMEERVQFRAAVATSSSNKSFNRATISPVISPIARAGGSIPPDGVATISPSVASGAFNELTRLTPPNARNLAGGFCQDSVSHFSFIASSHAGDFNHHQQSMRQMQNGYPAAYKRAFRYDRVH